jgi:transcriptional regulator with XRE-family HTH domain
MRRRMSKEKLIAFLINTRKENDITQAQLAKKLNRPQSFVSKYETGERNLDFVEVIEVFEGLGADPIEQITRMYRG